MKIRDVSGWTMFVFGSLALILGLIGLIRPEILLSVLGFEVVERTQRAASDYTIVYMTASSMASFNIGVYYILASLNDVKIFYRWTVPFRVVTFAVFTAIVLAGIAPRPFFGVGAWELAGALATGLALGKEDKK
jgi:Na+-driven multidrug efflux pump